MLKIHWIKKLLVKILYLAIFFIFDIKNMKKPNNIIWLIDKHVLTYLWLHVYMSHVYSNAIRFIGAKWSLQQLCPTMLTYTINLLYIFELIKTCLPSMSIMPFPKLALSKWIWSNMVFVSKLNKEDEIWINNVITKSYC